MSSFDDIKKLQANYAELLNSVAEHDLAIIALNLTNKSKDIAIKELSNAVANDSYRNNAVHEVLNSRLAEMVAEFRETQQLQLINLIKPLQLRVGELEKEIESLKNANKVFGKAAIAHVPVNSTYAGKVVTHWSPFSVEKVNNDGSK